MRELVHTESLPSIVGAHPLMSGRGRGIANSDSAQEAENSEWEVPLDPFVDISSSEEKNAPIRRQTLAGRNTSASSSTNPRLRLATSRPEQRQSERVTWRWSRLVSKFLHICRWQRLYHNTGEILKEYSKTLSRCVVPCRSLRINCDSCLDP